MHTKSMGLFGKFNHFIHNPFFLSDHDKKDESDLEMILRIGKKFTALLFIIFMFDTLLDWFLTLMDSVFELLHLIIEAIEYSVELLLTATLQTNHQESETIIVNGTIIIVLYVFYRFCIMAPVLYRRFTKCVSTACLNTLERESAYWRQLTLFRKIKLITVYGICASVLTSLLTL